MTQEIKENRLNKEWDNEEESPYDYMIINGLEKINANINTSQI